MRMFNHAFGQIARGVTPARRITEFFTEESVGAFARLVGASDHAPFEGFIFASADGRRRYSTRGRGAGVMVVPGDGLVDARRRRPLV